MLKEFEMEEKGGNPYRSKALSKIGLEIFPKFMSEAILRGNEITLANNLNNEKYWEEYETYIRDGIRRQRRRNIRQSAERLSLTEFSTWYVHGFARRLLDEEVDKCQVYRGAMPKWEPGECSKHEGLIISVQTIYDNHRARYWPEPGNPDAFSIPYGPGCHHIIKRI